MEKKQSNSATAWQKTCKVFRIVGKVLATIGRWIVHLRGIWMAIPVAYAAMKLAMYSRENLPEQVGINLLETGEFAQYISRDTAVTGCLAVTAACLLLMFLSRRALYPWLISIFSLVLPILLLITNVFPA